MSAGGQFYSCRINAWRCLAQTTIDDQRREWFASVVLEVTHRRSHALLVVIKSLIHGIREHDRVPLWCEHDRISSHRRGPLRRNSLAAGKLRDVYFSSNRS